jgi:hypothetical protein
MMTVDIIAQKGAWHVSQIASAEKEVVTFIGIIKQLRTAFYWYSFCQEFNTRTTFAREFMEKVCVWPV